MSEREELREPPSDQIWMTTEPIGLGGGWMWGYIIGFILAVTLIISLSLALL